jgi:hypothetical protein
MNLTEKYAPLAAGLSISQYCPPRCFELAGKRFDFVIDTNECTGDAYLKFTSETTVEWSIFGGKITGSSEYQCHKSDDYTYLVSYCEEVTGVRTNHTWIIDKEQELVTLLYCAVGENKYYPYLIDSHFGFGYIKVEGKEHEDRRRHGFTDDVAGTCVKWTYGHELSTVHVYYSSNWYRIGYPKDKKASKKSQETSEAFNEMMKALPGPDEPAFYVKIKEGMYLVSATEQNMEKILGEKAGFRSDTLCFLDNWNRMYSVGRGFGTMSMPDGDKEIFVMIGKYGSPEEVDDHFFTDPNPYLV